MMQTLCTGMSIDIGVGREITLGKAPNGHRIMLVRYLTDSEMERKREDSGNSAFLLPYTQEYLSLQEAESIVSRSEELQGEAFNMQLGLPITGDEMVKVGPKDLYIFLDESSGNVHLRRYWKANGGGSLKPHKRGVCMSKEEFLNFIVGIHEVLASMG